MEKKQLKISESEYAKSLGVAASAGATIGGAAFATARVWETDSNENNETLKAVEESSADGIVAPETISIEISNPVAADIAYTTDKIVVVYCRI